MGRRCNHDINRYDALLEYLAHPEPEQYGKIRKIG